MSRKITLVVIDYTSATVHLHNLQKENLRNDNDEVELFVSDRYGTDNAYFMTGEEIQLINHMTDDIVPPVITADQINEVYRL